MKRFVICLILMSCSTIYSQNSVVQDWTLNFPPVFDYGNFAVVDMEKDNRGNLFITGFIRDYIDDNSDLITFKVILSTGIVEWVRVYNGIDNKDDYPIDLETDDHGNCFVAASKEKINNTNYIIVKYSSSGQKVLEMEQPNLISDLFVDNSGKIYVTGYATIQYDSLGNMEWNVTYSSSWGIGMTVDAFGNVYVAGTLDNADFLTIKYDHNGQEVWSRSYNDLQDRLYYVALDDEGNIYSAGANVGGNTGDFGFFIFKYDQQGNLLWYRKYPAIWAQISGFVLSPSGNVYITGSGYPVGSNGTEYITLKYNSVGGLNWVQHYNGFTDFYDIPADLKIDFNEDVYITGYSSFINHTDAVTLKYTSLGGSAWVNTTGDSSSITFGEKIVIDGSNDVYIALDNSPDYVRYYPSLLKLKTNGTKQWISDFKGFCQPSAMKQDIKGNSYITGWGGLNDEVKDFITMKCDSSGKIVWLRSYNGPDNTSDEASDIDIDEEGNVYVTGQSKGIGTGFDYATIKYDSSGNQKWIARYNGPAFLSDEAQKISLDKNGNVYVTGNSLNSNGNYDIATIKYNSFGQLQWVKRYNGFSNGLDVACGLETDAAGNVYVGGTSDSAGTLYNYLVIKYSSNGNILWTNRYNGPGNDGDWAKAMVLDDSENVYVTGWSVGNGTNTDYATVKYNTSGVKQWAARWDDPASSFDYAYDIAVDGNENVYITGVSQGMGTDNDYTTVKYNSLGEQQWAVPYNGQSNGSDVAYHVTLDYLGNVYVAGYSNNNTEYATIKYNGEGILQWNESYIIEDYLSTPTDLLVDNSGNVIVAGYSSQAGQEWIWSIVKYKQPGFLPSDIKTETNPPTEFVLYQNYPNPFNPSTRISWQSPVSSWQTLKIYDVLGNEVVTLVNEEKPTGNYEIIFDAKNLSSGVYFYKLQISSFVETKKMILLR